MGFTLLGCIAFHRFFTLSNGSQHGKIAFLQANNGLICEKDEHLSSKTYMGLRELLSSDAAVLALGKMVRVGLLLH